MKVLLETSPLRNAHSIRGVGVYTRFLSQELEKLQNDQDTFFTKEDIGLDQLNAFMSKTGIDILHYPYFDLFRQTLPLPFIKKVLGRESQKIAVTIHDVIPLLYPKQYPVGLRGMVGLFLQKMALKDVAVVITDSETSRQDIHKYLGVPIEKITSVPLAGNPKLTRVSDSQIEDTKQRLELPQRYVLYVGDINYNKNVPELLKALALVDESIHLVCVGANFRQQPIPEWEAIQSVLPPVQKRVHFITSIAKDDTSTLSAVYSGAIAYVQPSLYEGFGLPLLEAMQCETLVVSSNTPALLEIGGDGVEFVSPTAVGLAKGISLVANLSEKNRQLRLEANKEALSKFSWQKAAQQTVQVYKSIL